MIFIIGMMFGSFFGISTMLFIQGAYKDDHISKQECDKQYLENQKKSVL